MTARELAEKLVESLDLPHPVLIKEAVRNIAILFEEYGRDRYKQAIEDAIKITDGPCGMHVDFWDSAKQSGKRAATKAIRALKDEAK